MRATLEVLRYYAARTPDRIALRGSNDTTLTYKDLLSAVTRICRLISAHRISVLALALDNGPEWIAADLAAQMAGTPLVPLPAYFSSEQLHHALTDSGADGIIADTRLLQRHGADLPLETLACVSRDARLARVACGDAVARVASGTAKVSYTSGSTGQPKGVCLPQSAMDAVAQSLWSACAALGLTRHLCTLPLPTLLENVAGIYAPLRNGAEICVPALTEIGFTGSTSIDTKRFLDCLARYAPESIILLPQTAACARHGARERRAPPFVLRFAAVGGGCVSMALLERADRLGLPVYEGYGLTECASVVALNTPDARRIGSVGRPLQHARVRIGARLARSSCRGDATCGYVGDARAGRSRSRPATSAASTRTVSSTSTAGARTSSSRRSAATCHPSGSRASSRASPRSRRRRCSAKRDRGTSRSSCPRTNATGATRSKTPSTPSKRACRTTHASAMAPRRRSRSRRQTGSRRRTAATGAPPIWERYRCAHRRCYYDELPRPRVALPRRVHDFLRAAARSRRPPIARACCPRRSSPTASPGRVSRETYGEFLTEAYHHVKHTVPLLMACGSRVPEASRVAARGYRRVHRRGVRPRAMDPERSRRCGADSRGGCARAAAARDGAHGRATRTTRCSASIRSGCSAWCSCSKARASRSRRAQPRSSGTSSACRAARSAICSRTGAST